MSEQRTKVYGVRLTPAECQAIDREKRRRERDGGVRTTRSETIRRLVAEALRMRDAMSPAKRAG